MLCGCFYNTIHLSLEVLLGRCGLDIDLCHFIFILLFVAVASFVCLLSRGRYHIIYS